MEKLKVVHVTEALVEARKVANGSIGVAHEIKIHFDNEGFLVDMFYKTNNRNCAMAFAKVLSTPVYESEGNFFYSYFARN